MATPSSPSGFDPASIGATPVAASSAAPAAGAFDPASVGAVPAQPPQQPNSLIQDLEGAGNFVGRAFNSVEKPFVSLAATPVQLLAKAMGKPDPYAGGIPTIGETVGNVGRALSGEPTTSGGSLDVAPITGKGLMEKAGQLAQIGTMALTPEAAGVTGIAKMAALGAAGGEASSVASGNGLTMHALGQGALYGAILGGLGNAARIVSGTEKAAAGVDPAMENELAQTRPSTLRSYIDTAKESAQDFHAPTVDEKLNDDIRGGLSILTKKVIPKAGKALDAAHASAGPAPITVLDDTGAPVAEGANAVNMLTDDINEHMQAMTGHQFASYGAAGDQGIQIQNYPEGASTAGIGPAEGGVIEPLPGRAVELSASDQKALETIHRQIQILKDNPTVQTASDVLKNLDAKIDWNRPQFGAGSSPVDGMLRYARGAINRSIAPAAPELAAANSKWGELMDIKNAIGQGAGKDLNHLDLLARRTLYSGQSGRAQSALDGLYGAVKPYLPAGEESYTTKAIIARFARDTFGGTTGKTGFAQGMSIGDISGASSGYISRVTGAALRTAKRALSPNPEQYAMSIAKEEPYSFVPLTHHIDELLDHPSNSAFVQGAQAALKKMGVSSAHVGQAAKDILRLMMYQNLMGSAGQAPGQRQLMP